MIRSPSCPGSQTLQASIHRAVRMEEWYSAGQFCRRLAQIQPLDLRSLKPIQPNEAFCYWAKIAINYFNKGDFERAADCFGRAHRSRASAP